MTSASSTAATSVVERVRIEKSPYRSLAVTVRPERPELLRRSETSSANRLTSSWSCPRSETSRANVSSAETETCSPARSRSRGSTPLARSRSIGPTDPGSSAFKSGSDNAASSPIVPTPARRSRCSARGPTPGSSRTASGARKRASVPGGTTVTPPGFRRSEAILQTTFDVPTPSEHVRLVFARTAVWIAEATARAPVKSSTTVPRSR